MTSIDVYQLQSISRWAVAATPEPSDDGIQKQLGFEDRDSYLVWRQEWRQVYAALSAHIREIRAQWRAEGSEHDPLVHRALFNDRALARTMLALRAASKAKSGHLREEAKVLSAS